MARRPELPADIGRLVLTGTGLADIGVTEHERRGPLWDSAFRGRYVWAATDAAHPAQRIGEAASLLPPGAAIGGWAAAWLLGAHELDGSDFTEHPPFDPDHPTRDRPTPRRTRGETSVHSGLVPVPLCVGPGDRIRPQSGVHLLRSTLVESDIVMIGGIPVTSPVRTAYDIGRGVGPGSRARVGIHRLMATVADFDAAVRDTSATPQEIADYAVRHPRWRGSALLRTVMSVADPRVASRPESALRVVWVISAGLAVPKVNWPVYDDDGSLLGVTDLLDMEAGLVGEYDGADHRRLDRHTRDNAREERIESHNLIVVRATSLDLYRRPLTALVARIQAGRRRGLARDRRMDRWFAGSRPLQ